MNLPVVLIADKLAQSTVAALGDQVEVRWVDGPDREKLLAAVGEADALLVRSATTVDAEVLAAAPKLKIVARAGVGLDNVDVDAATERGVLVVNAPTSNIHSAAEHALALLLAAAREIPAADASLREHTWKRSSFSGTEIFGKTVGVVGLGRIGQLVAQRLAAFGAHLIAYDPYVSPARAAQLGIELLSLDELLSRADFISVHLPKTPETAGLIDKEALAKTKPGVIIVNAARGGLVDEAALGRRGAQRPRARGRSRRVRQRAVHRQPAVRAAAGGGHSAPGRVHRRGPGSGRHRRRGKREARAGR